MVTFGLRLALCVAPLAATACSIRPSPQDYAHVATPDIVRQVRCEARAAIADNLGQWLSSVGETGIAARFPTDPTMPMSFDDKMFPATLLPVIQKFENSAVGYDFTLDMTETDNLDATFDFLGLLRHTTLSTGLSAGIDRTRENIATFTITDTFKGLLNMQQPGGDKGYCRKYVAVGNMTYPITGRIGLGEIVHNFFDLSLFSNLDGAAHKGTPATVNALTFTTKLAGSLTPKVVLGMASRGAQLLDGSLNAQTSRTDVHKLIISLALPDKSTTKVGGTTGNFITVNATTDAEIIAAQKIDQAIFRFEFGRASAGIVVDQ